MDKYALAHAGHLAHYARGWSCGFYSRKYSLASRVLVKVPHFRFSERCYLSESVGASFSIVFK